MLARLRKLFGRSNPPAEPKQTAAAVASRTGFQPLSATPARTHPPEPASTLTSPTAGINVEDVSIPLQSVLDALPPELKRRIIPTDLGGATLTVALTKVLSQLPSGAVKLLFGELRRAAPQLFSPGDQSDQQEVVLPLNELLVRINPALLAPSPKQKVAAGTDTLDDFIIPTGDFRLGDEIPEFSTPPGTTPARNGGGPMRVPLPWNLEETGLATPPVTESPGASSSSNSSMNLPLASLTANWPALVRAEIAQLDCARAQVVLPETLVQEGMKRGKVAFPWKTLRGWIDPAPPLVVSNHDATTLELPLEVLMPLFLKRWQQTPKTQAKLLVDETIPALFEPATPLESPSALEVTDSVVGEAESAATSAAFNSPSTDPKDHYTSPAEIVELAAALEGVAGALMVLPEGLLVASKLATQDPDGLAAFLARAFGRVAQNASDAGVGTLSRMEFWADDVHWIIFNLNSVLLATFGQAGGSLPATELAALAKAIERKTEA